MVIDLVVTKTDDGFISEVPSIKGCESWAHKEEEVIEKSLELVNYYLNLNLEEEIVVDKARKEKNKTIYKLIFDKDKK
ncbi:MAG: hypothetical protein K9J16_05910 [Melioribacteraceae bacterium]|nr:hypothetical protein [Melioribacteraceae bacterium]MCF8354646.1 hypothetical protein [Melioribacteraceae bacterium]MCF8394179.1 hypothetical protein [Melioribacteraceae bacterium]MCF8418862.1 hypothetical protein [Melioribacteraceae bacterium]